MGTEEQAVDLKKVGIVQFGEGNFLRAFVDWMFQELKNQELFFGKVLVVQPIAQGRCAELSEAARGYHVVLHGLEEGKNVLKINKVDVVNEWRNPYEESHLLEKLAEIAENIVIISNTTEAGIAFDPKCHFADDPPASFPAKLTKFLFRRFQLHAEKEVFVLPCELIDRNGTALSKAVDQQCDAWLLHPEFKIWLSAKVHFYNTLVDRIVSGYPKNPEHSEIASLAAHDSNLVVAEPYHLWVLEGPGKLESLLPFRRAGLNVIYTDRLKAHREAKVRMLNGLHTAMVPIGLSMGLNYVNECFEDEDLSKYLQTMLQREIIPGLEDDFPKDYLETYSQRILDRLRNPHLHHKLSDIALNSISKIQTRLFPTIKAFYKKYGDTPPLVTNAVAALLYNYAVPNAQAIVNEADPNTRDAIARAQQVFAESNSWHVYLQSLIDNDLIMDQFKEIFKLASPRLVSLLNHLSAKGISRVSTSLSSSLLET